MRIIRQLLLVGACATIVACGSSPVDPSPNPGPDPGPVVNNTPPVVGSFAVRTFRPGAPANFADVNDELEITATVTDAESQISALKFNWSAPVGSFIGSGAKVNWKAPADAQTPTDVTLSLEVVETYVSQGKSVENKVTGSTTVMLHHSAREVAALSRQFLLDFSDSSIPAPQVMRNFEESCYGTVEEASQVANNRSEFTIVDWFVDPNDRTTVNFGGACVFRNKPGDACSRIPVRWLSRANRDIYDVFTGERVFRAGDMTTAMGVDQLAARYYPSQKRWKLCDSQFEPGVNSLHALRIFGLVP